MKPLAITAAGLLVLIGMGLTLWHPSPLTESEKQSIADDHATYMGQTYINDGRE